MKRKEIKARTITQSNNASCHGSGNGHRKGDHAKKRHSSKLLRQALAQEDRLLAIDPVESGPHVRERDSGLV